MKIYEKKQECEQIKIEIRRLQEIGKKHQKCQKERENLQKKNCSSWKRNKQN